MERIKREESFRRSYWPVVVYFEDLEDIVSAMENVGKEVSIANDDYKFASLSEAKEVLGKKVQTRLAITCSYPSAEVSFKKEESVLYVTRGEKAAHLRLELDSIVARCQRKGRRLYSIWIGSFASALAFSLSGFNGQLSSPWDLVAIIVMIISALWLIWASYIRLMRNSVVRFERRSERRGFVERNSDQIGMIIVSTIIGGLLTFGGLKFKETFFPSAPTTASSPSTK